MKIVLSGALTDVSDAVALAEEIGPRLDGVVKTSIYCVVCPVAILNILHV